MGIGHDALYKDAYVCEMHFSKKKFIERYGNDCIRFFDGRTYSELLEMTYDEVQNCVPVVVDNNWDEKSWDMKADKKKIGFGGPYGGPKWTCGDRTFDSVRYTFDFNPDGTIADVNNFYTGGDYM